MKITDYKAQKMFDVLLQDCFNYADDRHVTGTSGYKFELYSRMAEDELISVPVYYLLVMFPSIRRGLFG